MLDVRAARCRPASIPSVICSGSASRTRRRCSRASRWPSPRRSARRSRAARGDDGARRRLPHLRHDLQRDAGAAGRRARAARRAGVDVDGRDRRLQLEQHDLARRALRGARADVSHRDVGGDRSGGAARSTIASAPIKHDEADASRLAARGPGARRHHRRREHAEQQDRRRRRAHPRDARAPRPVERR